MSDSENSDHEVESSVDASHYSQKKPAPVKALAALAKARQAKAEKKALEKKEKEDMKKKKEEAVKAISSIRKPKEPMPKPISISENAIAPSNEDLIATISKLNEKLEKKSKKKVVIQSDSSSSEEEIVIKKPKKKIHVPAVDPEFEQWKSYKEKRQLEEATNQKEQQLKMDLKKLFSRY
jgi:hypothetical protein